MTKKDYQLLARAIGAAFVDAEQAAKEDLLKDAATIHVRMTIEKLLVRVCNALKGDNSRFDEDKFYEAVYGKGGK